MPRIWIHARAPFAAYRGMQAGVYRTTAPVMPPSSAYGLLMNLAGIETRDSTPGVTTRMKKDLPCVRIAIGALSTAKVGTLYQQLHGYPVGNSGKELEARTHGAKFWIAPARRELLIGLDIVIGVESADGALLERARRGVRGELAEARYGLPFAGDNNLLFDRLDFLEAPPSAHWYTRIGADDPPRKGSCRLTVGIDRDDNSGTTSVLVAPATSASVEPPENAWTWTPREAG